MTFAGFASDSREVKPGYLFAALPGTRTDGGAFVAEAVRRGATAVLGEPKLRATVEALGVRFIADDNPRRRLALLAAEHFAAQPEIVAAITGTNGKTSVAPMRGCCPLWFLKSINSVAVATARSAASTITSGDATKLITERL